MTEDPINEMLEDLMERADVLGIDTSSLSDGQMSDDDKRDASIMLMRAMFEVLTQGLSETSSELEHMYDAVYQTFHDSLEPIRNIWKLSGIMVNDQQDGRSVDPRYARVINSSSQFLMMVMDDLMNLMVLRRRRGELSEKFSLSLAADEAVEHLFSQIEEAGARVVVDRDLPVVVSNRSRWARIFQNIIKNGIIYNQSDPPIVTISSDDGIVLVSDNGMGIRKTDMSRIFGLFTRLKDRKHMSTGTGSGLYQVSRLLVDDHATIRVESEVGEGSTFIIDVRELIAGKSSPYQP
jgi:light-regulated signal transduction histidine kinase (bacteriophytochrome)